MKDYKKSYKEVLGDHFPDTMEINLGKQKLLYQKKKWVFNGQAIGLRYGDNPGQESALYELKKGSLELGDIEYVKSHHGLISNLGEEELTETGKHIGKSNLTDLDAAINILKYFDEPTAVIVKHNNPSGVACRNLIADAYQAANMADRIAAFGGVLVVNRAVTKELADEILKNYLEVVAAPSYDEEALKTLTTKKNMRIMKIAKLSKLEDYRTKKMIEFKALIDGGIIVQQSANNFISKESIENAEVIYKEKPYKVNRKPTEQELEDMIFGWKVLQGVISNSMLFAKNKTTVAICAGEQDRVGATELAIAKAYKKMADVLCFQKYQKALWELQDPRKKQEIEAEVNIKKANLIGSVLVSDGFLPFRDTVDVAAKEGISGIIQPGGSTKDYQSIEACNEYDLSMAFTGKRIFRH